MSSPAPNSRPVPTQSRPDRRDQSGHRDQSYNRGASNARLASPIPSSDRRPSSPSAHASVRQPASGTYTPLAGISQANASGPGSSALTDALQRASVAGTAPTQLGSSPGSGSQFGDRGRTSIRQDGLDGTKDEPYEDFDIVRRHLAGPGNVSPAARDRSEVGASSPRPRQQISQSHLGGAVASSRAESVAPGIDEGEFSSLRMQGGDITRDIYRRAEAEASLRSRPQRTQSMFIPHDAGLGNDTDVASINQPGGFRRDHIRRHAESPHPPASGRLAGPQQPATPRQEPQFVARNFFEFLSLYGHFAGEDVEGDDSWDEDSETAHGRSRDEYDSDDEPAHEGTALLKSVRRRKRRDAQTPKAGTTATVLMLLKSFVGTGVLFLPRAFLNGGMAFSIAILVGVATLSYYCFLLLTTSRLKLQGSFAEMGEMVQGRWLRFLINASLVISQIGFTSAYIVFTSENLQAFILAVSKCKTFIEIKFMILMQLIIFLPLSLYRNLNNISFVIYVADLLIVLGLVYLYYFDISTLATYGISPTIKAFNQKGWTLFIGTAIFTFEGIGLIIPIQDGMKKPSQLPGILGMVMIIIAIIFVSSGALAYGAFGAKTETVILLNMPQDNKFVNGVQFIYSVAILLSTPLQIFPAITIMENGIFKRSGKYNKFIKWRKNVFRFVVVMASALIAWVGANDLDKFVALVGSFACIPLVYIYPPIIHFSAVAQKRWQRWSDVLLCVFGVVLMAYTSVLTIASWVGGVGEPKAPRLCDPPPR